MIARFDFVDFAMTDWYHKDRGKDKSMLRERPFPLRPQRMHLDSYRKPYLGSPWRNLFYAVIPVVVAAIGFGLAARSSTPPLPPVAAPVASVNRSDKLYVEPAPPSVVTVRTIPIVLPEPVPQPLSPPPPVTVAADEEVSPDRVRPRFRGVQKRGDICTRHGKRKVTTRGGRSWRCR